jgi:hypothetical protein
LKKKRKLWNRAGKDAPAVSPPPRKPSTQAVNGATLIIKYSNLNNYEYTKTALSKYSNTLENDRF